MRKEDEIRQAVVETYARLAEVEGPCCLPCSCGCGTGVADRARAVGYGQEELANIPEPSIMGLGCGNPVAWAELEEGETVLDLGSGSGMDVFLAAARVGPKGRIIGVDITEEMVAKAKEIAAQCGYDNVEFRVGQIEDLPLETETVDVVLSNCVINLSTDKARTFQEAYQALRSGGRLVISDLVSRGEIPVEVREDLASWAGCVGGVVEREEYLAMVAEAGFRDIALLAEGPFYELRFPDGRVVEIASIQLRARK